MASGGVNKGFLRDEAYLAILMITDTDDYYSDYTPETFLQKLMQIKGGDIKKLLAYAAIIPSSALKPNCRHKEESKPVLLEEFLDFVISQDQVKGANYFNLCTSNYGEKLASIGNDLKKRIGFFIPLDQFPIIDTIVVKYGSQIIPADSKKGWVYDPFRVGIKISSEVLLKEEEGAELSVSFLPADYLNK